MERDRKYKVFIRYGEIFGEEITLKKNKVNSILASNGITGK